MQVIFRDIGYQKYHPKEVSEPILTPRHEHHLFSVGRTSVDI